jgi:hypothetical protein
MCPLCIATGTIALASAGSAGGLGAIAARILRIRRKRAAQGTAMTDRWRGKSADFRVPQKANAGSVARSGIVPAKAA